MERSNTIESSVIGTSTSYVQDFNGFSDGTTDLGDGSVMFGQAASIQNNKLRLTIDGQGLGFSSFSIPGISNSSKGWTAEFDYELFDSLGSNDPADGFSLNYGNAPLGDQGSAEEGMAGRPGVTENISFEVDTWRNGDAEQGVNISGLARGGTDVGQLAFRNGVILEDGSSKSGKMTFSWNPEDGASFTTTGLTTNANFSNVSTSDFVANDNHTFNISARVGEADQTFIIDNLTISGLDPDSDSDGIQDQQEIALGLNPNKNDSDNDGVLDGQEITDGTDPKDSESFSIGSKITQTIELDSPGTYSFSEVSAGDGLTLTAYMDVNGNNERDSWEPVTNPLNTGSFSVSNLEQINMDLTLVDPDNDQDGLPAYKEILVYDTSDDNPDSDNDGINDGQEVANGSNPKDNTSPGANLSGQVTYGGEQTGGKIVQISTVKNADSIDEGDNNSPKTLPESLKMVLLPIILSLEILITKQES